MKNPAVFTALAALAFGAQAQQAGPSLETVLVSAAMEPIPASESGSSVFVLEREALEQRQLAPLAEILRSAPGLAVNRSGVVGSQTQLRLRGAEANQVLVIIDGVRANDPALGSEFNMAHLLNYGIESVEIIRGPQSALWGSDAMAGVINITTLLPEEGFGGDLFAEGGSNAWQHAGASARYGDEHLQAALSLSSLDTDGENISRQGNEDDGYENRTANLTLAYRASETLRFDGNLRYTDAENEFDGVDYGTTGLPADSDNRSDTEQLYGRLAARLDTLDGRWSHKLSVAVTNTDNENREENAYAATGYDVTNYDADVTVLGYQARLRFAEGHALTAAYEYQEQDYRQRGPVGFGDPNRDEDLDSHSYVLEYRGRLTPAISVLASARHDDNSDFDDKTTGRLSAAWRLNDGATKLRAAFGTGIKNPSFVERFGYFNDFIGNPDLEPEESTGWEVGIDQLLFDNRASLSLTWFQEELEDEINGFVFDPATGGTTAANEPGTSDRKGIEFDGRFALAHNLDLQAAYTWLDATEEDAGGASSDETRRPEHIASLGINWRFLDDRANLNLNVDYNGEQDDLFFPPVPPYQERVELDDFTLLTLTGSYRFDNGLQLFARVENGLDEDYEEVYGFVAPGRTAYLGLRYRFGD
jgi:vitamin B12 transporter